MFCGDPFLPWACLMYLECVSTDVCSYDCDVGFVWDPVTEQCISGVAPVLVIGDALTWILQ